MQEKKVKIKNFHLVMQGSGDGDLLLACVSGQDEIKEVL